MNIFFAACIALAAHYAVYRGVLQVQWETPRAGCYWVVETEDLYSWTVVTCGCEDTPVHGVAAVDADKPKAFYQVWFRPE